MPAPLIRTFSKVCRNSQDSSQKRDQCRSSIRTTLRYDSVIPMLNLKAFPPAGKPTNKKMNWVRLAEHGRIPTNAKYMNPRISFDGLNWWISVCVEFPDCRETLNDDGVGIDLGIKELAVCSDGTKYKNINKSQKVKKLEKQKRRLQRSISRSYEKNKKGGKLL